MVFMDYNERLLEDLLDDEMFTNFTVEEIEEVLEYLELDDLYKD